MRCQGCGASLASAALSCPTCAARRSRRELLDHQRQFLPLVSLGRMQLKLIRLDAHTHILLFGTDQQTYCGRSVPAIRRPNNPALAFELQPYPCGECRKVLEELQAVSA